MQIRYKVHSVAPCEREATASIDGRSTVVKVPMAAVELVSDDAHQTNPTIYMPPEEAASLERGMVVTTTLAWARADKESAK